MPGHRHRPETASFVVPGVTSLATCTHNNKELTEEAFTVPELTSAQLSEEFPGNEWLVADIYEKYKADKSSVDENGPRSSPVSKLPNLLAHRRSQLQTIPPHQQNPTRLNLPHQPPHRSKRLKIPTPPHHQLRRQNRLNQKFDAQKPHHLL